MDLELGPACFGGMPSSSSSSSPSHRNPLALLTKLKHQLAKSPSARHRRRHSHHRNRSRNHLQQPIEHQYLPISAISSAPASESLSAQSTYSCSNHSSSGSSFVFIDHSEEPGSFGVDEYTPFLPLIIQHERLQQRLAAAAATPPLSHTRGQRERIPPPNLNDPPSPASTTSSKSPVTPPIFASPFFRTGYEDEDVDEIMTLSSSEVGSISAYSLPRSLRAYRTDGQSIRSPSDTKSTRTPSLSISNSESESMAARSRRTRPIQRCHPPRNSLPPSPPPSWPLPEPPVSVRPRTIARASAAIGGSTRASDVRPDSAVLTMDIISDSESGVSLGPLVDPVPSSSSSRSGGNRGRVRSVSTSMGLRKDLPASMTVPVPEPTPSRPPSLRIITQSNTQSSTSILSDLEISHSTSASCHEPLNAKLSALEDDDIADGIENSQDGNDTSDDFVSCVSVSNSTPTTPTPTRRQYGVGRRVISGSGRDFGDLNDLVGGSKSLRRESVIMGKTVDSGVEDKEEGVEKLTEVDGVHSDMDIKQHCTNPNARRRVKSDYTSLSIDSNTGLNSSAASRRMHRETLRERVNSEWTLFLGIPRNALPPAVPPSAVDPGPSFSPTTAGVASALESNANHAAVPPLGRVSSCYGLSTLVPTLESTPPHVARPTVGSSQSRDQTFLSAHHSTTMAMMVRNRTKSDSALLASASSAGVGTSGASMHDDGEAKKIKSKGVAVRGGDDWTLSLPLAAPPSPSSLSAFQGKNGAGERGQGLKYFEPSSMVPGTTMKAIVAEVVEGREREAEAEDSTIGPVITVEDVDCQQPRVEVGDAEEAENEDEVDNSFILRVPRIVRSCSSPLLSTSADARTRLPSSKTTPPIGISKWIGATSKPNLRARVEQMSSSTLEEEVMSMLLGDDNDGGLSDEIVAFEEDERKSKSKSRKDLATTLARKKIAALNEDLARFNDLLRNGTRPSTATGSTSAATTGKVKTKVTLNTKPSDPHPISTSQKSIVAPQTLSIKPVLKHAKSCEPFHLSDAGVVPSPSMGPVMRFPSSTGRGDLNFFDELGGGDGRDGLKLTRSSEWRMYDSTSSSVSSSLPLSSSSSQRSTRSSVRSISPPNLTSSTQTLLLPFASSSSTSLSSSSVNHNTKCSPSSFNSKPKGGSPTTLGSLGIGAEMNGASGAKRGVVTSPKTSSIRAVSMELLRPSTAPVESSLGRTPSRKSQKQGPPTHLRLHTTSFSSSPSSSHRQYRRSISPPSPPSPVPSESECSSALPTPLASAFPIPPTSFGLSGFGAVRAFQQKLREFESAREKQRGIHYQQQTAGQQQQNQSNRPRSISSSVASLASVTSSVSNASSADTVVPSGDQKLRMRSSEPRVDVHDKLEYGVGDDVAPIAINDDGSATPVDVEASSSAVVQENERYTSEDDEDSTCSGTYYSARSSFSIDRV